MDIAELAQLPLTERLAAMEALWESLTHDPAHDPSPAWHADVLAARRRQLADSQVLPWDEVKHRLRGLADDARKPF